MRQRTINVIQALLDGLTGAGLFQRLRYPGSPRFAVDPRSASDILAETPWLSERFVRSAANDKSSTVVMLAGRRSYVEPETHTHG